ncbi:hypothetical protein [Streptomyces sp. NRRL B-1347]|uniref:hypothetical protein n=1 Tax=Streptomyces sp. NRRL B-1347 TaxID=1476877 RepID=UPI0004CB3D27|nr:hypothetical protein [Streptomyces sp. NRRL B-1347]
MGCGCNKNKREQFQVVTAQGSGRAVYTSTAQQTAVSVSRRYPGSVVKSTKSGDIVHRNTTPAAKT